MINPREIRTLVVAILLLLTVAFIFSNLLLPEALSKGKSLGVMEIVKPVLEFYGTGLIKEVWIDCGGFLLGCELVT